jgi:hypothetical protein
MRSIMAVVTRAAGLAAGSARAQASGKVGGFDAADSACVGYKF